MPTASGISFTWTPLPKIMASGFDTLAVDVKTFRKPLNQSVQRVMAPSLAKNFAVGGRPERWQPLTDSTIKRKSYKGHGSSPLIATGKLAKRAGAFQLWTVNESEAKIQSLPSDISYGGLHQVGWTPASGGLGGLLDVEPRPWALFQREDYGEIEEIFFEWIEDRIETNIKHGRV